MTGPWARAASVVSVLATTTGWRTTGNMTLVAIARSPAISKSNSAMMKRQAYASLALQRISCWSFATSQVITEPACRKVGCRKIHVWAFDEIQLVSNEEGVTTAVIVPIDLWREIESERETAYLLRSKDMATRLIEAKDRTGGRSLRGCTCEAFSSTLIHEPRFLRRSAFTQFAIAYPFDTRDTLAGALQTKISFVAFADQ